MRAEELVLLHTPGRPAVAADGTVVVAVSTPDVELDRYRGNLRRLTPGRSSELFTLGPRDSAPALSPDGSTLVFLRARESGPSQLFAIPSGGGEPRQLTDHPLGAGPATFSRDGKRIAYLAAVPERGRYGTDPDVGSEAEPPRRINWMNYRRDGRGFTLDKPEQVHVLDLDSDVDLGARPRRLTDEPGIVSGPVFLPDGRLVYARTVAPDLPRCELVTLADGDAKDDPEITGAEVGGAATQPVGVVVVQAAGNVTQLVSRGDDLYYLGAEFDGIDVAGRTTGLWSVPATGSGLRRLTGDDVEIDGSAAPVPIGSVVLVSVLDRGTVSLRAVPQRGSRSELTDLPVVIGGERVVTSFDAARASKAESPSDGITVAAVVADPGTAGEVLRLLIADDGTILDPERPLTDLSADLRSAGLARHLQFAATAPDGYPVHGFLVLPEGQGPHPVLLVIHGGPHAAYGWGLFDEAQVYAAAGYAVVLPNPRGSAGYGQEHGRTVLGRLGTVDVDDVLALLDAALERADCDSDRVGVMGGSYGGFMTSWLSAKAPERFTAAISERAVNAWDSFAGSSDIGYFFAENYTGPDRESQWKASPLAYADDIGLPLLIIHSEHDWRCPVEQAQRLFVALKRRGAEVEMLLFPAEGHELSRSGRPRHRLARFQAILSWWDRHLSA